jgi:ankyrin repeat protein
MQVWWSGFAKLGPRLTFVEGYNKDTTLLSAVKASQPTMTRLFLGRDGVDPEIKDSTNRTPLLWAAENGNK